MLTWCIKIILKDNIYILRVTSFDIEIKKVGNI